MLLRQPLSLTGTETTYNISVKVKGGGDGGQAGAVRLGIARALCEYDINLRPMLKAAGFLTRDSRAKERKKPGLKRARKAPQYTKR
jgi:small subunit ribosomal protein S9